MGGRICLLVDGGGHGHHRRCPIAGPPLRDGRRRRGLVGREARPERHGRSTHLTTTPCEISMRTGGWILVCYRGRDSSCTASWALLVVSTRTCVGWLWGVIQGVCERDPAIKRGKRENFLSIEERGIRHYFCLRRRVIPTSFAGLH